MTTANCHSKALSNKNRNFLIGLLLLLAVLLAYIPAMQGGYIWDDPYHVSENSLLKNSDGLRRIWFEPGATPQYYPLTHTSFWIEYQIWELAPFGYHLVNVLLHLLNAVLVWRILLWLHVPGALFAAAVFALHPVHVESVAWISERKNVLSGLFYLSALSIYLRFALRGNGIKGASATPTQNSIQPSGRCYKGLYTLSLGLYLCALLSKTVTCSLPVVILLLLWWKRGQFRWRDVQALIPMFMVGMVLGINTIFQEKSVVGARGAEWAFSFIDRCLIAGRALWFYVGKLVWPENLSFTYTRWQIDSGLWWQYLYPLAALAVMFTLWIARGRIGKAPIVAVLIFSVTLLPALGFIDVYPMRFSFVADHFQYLASISLIALFVSSAATAFKKYINGKFYIGLAGGLTVLVVLGVLTFNQGYIYKNVETLYRDTLTKNPNSWMAHNNLSIALLERGDLDGAIVHSMQALRIRPDELEIQLGFGELLKTMGKAGAAVTHYENLLKRKPRSATVNNALAAVLFQNGLVDRAIAHYMTALEIDGDFVEAHNGLGVALVQAGQVDRAIGHYRRAIQIDTGFTLAYYNLGVVLIIKGETELARDRFRSAISTDPDYAEPHYALGALSLQEGDFAAACGHFNRVLQIDPLHPGARKGLGLAMEN